MKIISVESLAFPEVKVIRFGRFSDERGYFTEPYRQSDFKEHPQLEHIFKNLSFVQMNESYSREKVLRGLHFQWLPPQGKLIRTFYGRMIDLVMDIRKNSPNYGKIIAYDMSESKTNNYSEWIWVPFGFAHGNFFTEETRIEYYCTGEYNPNCEAGINPLSEEIDWSLCDKNIKNTFDSLKDSFLISEKDRKAMSLTEWGKDERSNYFMI
ncbi:MAG: dTDP-4-keto-6-deoxy-D-glucose epimerase [Ignavibacteria bacterium]|nr:dTDP-4-keto-6-deoxy-D-glucose epimerase [Ignavibacteria bacterium]